MNVYDFDKTIYDGDSTIDFYLYCIKKRPLLIFLLPYTILFYFLYKLGIINKKRFKEAFFIFLKYINNLDKEVKLFWENNINKIKHFYYDNHKNSDLIISASPDFLLKPLEKILKFTVIATKFDIKNIKIIGDNCYGEEKVKRYNQFTNKKIMEFYSDSYSDEPLAKLADKSFIVDKFKIDKWGYNKNKETKKISSILFYIGFSIFLYIFGIIFINSLLLIFKREVSSLSPLLSLLIVIIYTFFRIKKNSYRFINMFVLVFLIGFSIFTSAKVYDHTWDANRYHKLAIGFLAEGWNPLYETSEEFIDRTNSPVPKVTTEEFTFKQKGNTPKLVAALWVNSYAKASYFYGASIYKLTNRIETAKSINILSAFGLFLIIVSILYSNSKKIMLSILIPLAIITLPTITTQLFSSYIDGLVFIYMFLLLTILLSFDFNKIKEVYLDYSLLYFITLVILINIKFSSFGYAGILCLFYYIYYFIRSFKNNDFKFFNKFTIISFIAVIIGVFVVGLSVYPKNFIKHKHPFYPLMGENKVDIMTPNQPASFNGMSPIKRNFYSIFSKYDNYTLASNGKFDLKIPFRIYKEEIKIAYHPDMRLSGNGILFSGIFIISIISIVYQLIIIYKKERKKFYLFLMPIMMSIILMFTFGESWWARYFPQIHFIVFLNLILLLINMKKINKIIIYLTLILLFINNIIPIYANIKYSKEYNFHMKNHLNYLTGKNCNISIYTDYFHGQYFNIKDRTNVKIVFETEKIKDYKLYSMVGYGLFWRCQEQIIKEVK